MCTENCTEALSADWPCKEGHPGTADSARQCPPETQAAETYGPAPRTSSTNASLKETQRNIKNAIGITKYQFRTLRAVLSSWFRLRPLSDWTHQMLFFARNISFTARNVKSVLQSNHLIIFQTIFNKHVHCVYFQIIKAMQ